MKAVAWLNNTMPATRAEAERRRDEVPGAHIPFIHGYKDDDPLLQSELEFQRKITDPLLLCEYVFAQMNHDARLNGPRERSLSIGDVVQIIGDDERWFACKDEDGWEEIERPTNLTARAVAV
jgi:hypothetical protein